MGSPSLLLVELHAAAKIGQGQQVLHGQPTLARLDRIGTATVGLRGNTIGLADTVIAFVLAIPNRIAASIRRSAVSFLVGR